VIAISRGRPRRLFACAPRRRRRSATATHLGIDARDSAGNITQSAREASRVDRRRVIPGGPQPGAGREWSLFDGSGSTDNSKATPWEWDLEGDGYSRPTPARCRPPPHYPAKPS